MTAPPRTLQERLRDVSICSSGCRGRCVECPADVAAEVIDALDRQSQLLAEAREALEPFAKAADCPSNEGLPPAMRLFDDVAEPTIGDLHRARAVHAKLKAASGEG